MMSSSLKRKCSPEASGNVTKRFKQLDDSITCLQQSSMAFHERLLSFCRNRRSDPDQSEESEGDDVPESKQNRPDARIESSDDAHSDVEIIEIDSNQDDEVQCTEDEKGEYGKCLESSLKRSVLELRTTWKCANCLKDIRGKRYHRLRHVEIHENFKMKCPIGNCKALLGMRKVQLHLAAKHQKKANNLTNEEKALLDKERKRCLEAAKNVDSKYFPEGNILEILKFRNDTNAKDVKQAKAPKTGDRTRCREEGNEKTISNDKPICKKCGASVGSRLGQKDHVAVHLGLKLSCPYSSCGFKSASATISYHLSTVHLKSVTSLNEKRRKRYRESQEAYTAAVNAVKSEYFSETFW